MRLISMLATYGTMIEIALIIIIIFSSLIFKTINGYRAKNILLLTAQIEAFIVNKMEDKKQVTNQSFPNSWKKISILLNIVNKFDKNIEENNWLQIKANFIRNIILPLARQAALSNNWRMRHYAALAFTFYSDNADEKIILQLLNDDIPLVRYSAANAGIIYGSEKAIELNIKQIAKESWLTQTIYMQAFEKAPYATHYFLERLMQTSQEFSIRTTSYNLLLRYPIIEISWDINSDIHSQNELLSLSAIRYLTYNKKELALPTLLNLLEEANWKVKAVALACLGDLKQVASLAAINTCAKDQNWWVRVATTQASKKLGMPNQNTVSLSNSHPNGIHFDIAQYIVNTF